MTNIISGQNLTTLFFANPHRFFRTNSRSIFTIPFCLLPIVYYLLPFAYPLFISKISCAMPCSPKIALTRVSLVSEMNT